jgi:hypothetical protein
MKKRFVRLRFSRRWLWRMPFSGMWRRVVLGRTDVSEERIASLFSVEKSTSKEPAWADGCRLGICPDDVQAFSKLLNWVTLSVGLAIAQAVSRRLPTTTARVRSQARTCGICCGQSDTEAGFLLPILIPLNAPYSSIVQGCYNSPISGRRSKAAQPAPPYKVRNKLRQSLADTSGPNIWLKCRSSLCT